MGRLAYKSSSESAKRDRAPCLERRSAIEARSAIVREASERLRESLIHCSWPHQ